MNFSTTPSDMQSADFNTIFAIREPSNCAIAAIDGVGSVLRRYIADLQRVDEWEDFFGSMGRIARERIHG